MTNGMFPVLADDWAEWEAKPSSPGAIRLISFGKLLDDKAPLRGMEQLLNPLDAFACIRLPLLTVLFSTHYFSK